MGVKLYRRRGKMILEFLGSNQYNLPRLMDQSGIGVVDRRDVPL
jgi:hypothetical protein